MGLEKINLFRLLQKLQAGGTATSSKGKIESTRRELETAEKILATRYKEYEGEEKHLRKLLEKEPDNPVYNFNLGKVLRNQISEISESEKYFKRTVELKPNFAPPYFLLGSLYIREDLPKAIQYLRKAVDLEPDNAEYNYLLGEAFINSNELTKAKQYFERAIQLDPADNNIKDRYIYLLNKLEQV